MHALLIDPALIELSGHHYNYNMAIATQLRANGFDVSILAHKRCDQAICDQLGALHCFDIDNYAFQDSTTTVDQMMRKVEITSTITLANLQEARRPELTDEDVILIHTATIFQLPAYRHWYAGLPEPRPRIVVQFMHPPWYLGLEDDPAFCATLLKNEMDTWHAQPGQRVRFVSDNALMARFLERTSGRPVPVLPMPMAFPDMTRVEAPSGNARRIRFSFLGDARAEKGFPLFAQALLDNHHAIPEEMELFIHISNTSGLEVAADLAAVPRCTVLTRQLGPEEYWTVLAASDVIVLPYAPDKYKWRGSGIFIEALGMAKPVIVTSGSALDWLLAHYGAAGARAEFSPASVWDAMLFILKNASEFQELAQQAAPAIRAHHNPRSFVDALVKALP
jgi:glycosyltransferase involved in cell wall biosynthesis